MNAAGQPLKETLDSHSELLILPDGRILVHNLTQTMAMVLHELNHTDNSIGQRVISGPELQAANQIIE